MAKVRRSVLVIDDVKLNRQILTKILSPEYNVLEAFDGQDALTTLEKHGPSISVILLDLIMPVMDGFQLMDRIKDDNILSQIPIIVVSGNTDKEIEVRALAAGASDFIFKPYNPDLILHCVQNVINLKEASVMINALQEDRLTGLFNRFTFFAKVEEMMAEHPSGYFMLSCFDIDNFKIFNDQYGTAEGDRVLRELAQIIKKDMAEVDGIGSRINADNFAALYPAKELDLHVDFITKMKDFRPFETSNSALLTFSIGRVLVNDLSLSASSIYDRAYIAKQSVKGRYDTHSACFDESMRENLILNQEITQEMDGALKNHQFEVWFQPQFNHATEAMIGSEALVRWRHPTKGMISPGIFIPIFEQNGFVYQLDKFVWEEVCIKLRKWIDEGHSPLPVSVNISRYDIYQKDLVSFICSLLKKYRLPNELLRLEITESAFSKSTSQIIKIVKEFADLGFTMEIDDFGSGYSSLNTLNDVPAHVIKLDMRFLHGDGNSERSGNILESVVRMIRWLGMSVIAEGVETIEQADYLKSIGCSYLQGYLYARPMPASEFEEFSLSKTTEEKMVTISTVENLNNNSFWDPKSMDTLIFNSFIGGACIFEFNKGNIELLRATDKYTQVIGSAGMKIEDALKLNWAEHLDRQTRRSVSKAIETSISNNDEVSGEFIFYDLPGCSHETFLRSTLRVIATAGDRYLVYCSNENITAQRLAERKQQEFENLQKSTSEQLDLILNNVGSGVTASVMHEYTMELIFANPKYYEILGFTKEQFEKEVEHFRDRIHIEDRSYVVNSTAKAYSTLSPLELEYRIIQRGGQLRWIRGVISYTHLTTTDAPVQLTVYRDITEEKQNKIKIQEADDQLRFLNKIAHELLTHANPEEGLQKVLYQILDYFKADKAFIYEFIYDHNLCKNTYLVTAPVPEVKADSSFNTTLDCIWYWLKTIEDQNSLFVSVVEDDETNRSYEFEFYRKNGIKTVLAVGLRFEGKLIGALGLFNPTDHITDHSNLNALGDYASSILRHRDLDLMIKSDNVAFQSLMNDTPGGFARMQLLPDGRLSTVYVNDQFCKIRKMEREEILRLGKDNALNGIHPDDIPLLRATISEMRATGNTCNITYRLRQGDGNFIAMLVFARITKNSQGEVFINAYFADLSESQKKEMSIREMIPIVLSTIMKESDDLSFVKDRNFKYICCSKGFAEMVGLSQESDIIGLTDYEIFDKRTADKYRDADEALFKEGKPILNQIEAIPSNDNTQHYSNTSKFILKDDHNKIIGLYGIGRDIVAYHQYYSKIIPKLKKTKI